MCSPRLLQRIGTLLILAGLLVGPGLTAFSMMMAFWTENPERLENDIGLSFTLSMYLIPLAGIGLALLLIGTLQRVFPKPSAPVVTSQDTPTTKASQRIAKASLFTVGAASIVMALVGLAFSTSTGYSIMRNPISDTDAPYLMPAFYSMSGICLVFYLGLFACGIQFLRLRPTVLKYFVGILFAEFVYFTLVGAGWLIPGIGMSIGAATGIANGGLVLQILTLFPIWAPILAWWAARRLSPAGNALACAANSAELTQEAGGAGWP